jgi:hypothetical protein
MKIKEFPQEIKDLIKKRMSQSFFSLNYDEENELRSSFIFWITPEGRDFWISVDSGDFLLFYEKYPKVDETSNLKSYIDLLIDMESEQTEAIIEMIDNISSPISRGNTKNLNRMLAITNDLMVTRKLIKILSR